LQQLVQEVVDRIYTVGRHPSAVIKGLKCAAACMGLCNDFMAEPFHRFRDPERGRIRQAVEELSALVQETLRSPSSGQLSSGFKPQF
jgi:2-dehydro-3-deoxy-D-pentonate aldolase